MKKKLLLINPSYEEVYSVPHGLLSIMGYLEDKKIPFVYLDLDIVDNKNANSIKNKLRSIYKNNKILLTGVSSLIPNYYFVRFLVRIIKEIDPTQKIVVGGSLGATLPHSLHQDLGADYLAEKDGEYVLEKISKILTSDENCSSLKLKKLIKQQPQYFDVPGWGGLPAYDQLEMKKYIKRIAGKDRMFSVISGRGCPMNCNFCFKMSGSKIRKKRVDIFVKELAYLKKRFGIEEFGFADDNFAIDKGWIERFLNELDKKKLKIKWRFMASLQLLNDLESIKKMQTKGLIGISMGLESGSPRMLKRMSKNIPIKRASTILKRLRGLGLQVNFTFIVGYPGETEKSLNQTLSFINKNCPRGSFNVYFFTPYPKTVGYQHCLNKKIIKDEKEYILNQLKDCTAFSINCTRLNKDILLKYRKAIMSAGLRDNYQKKPLSRIPGPPERIWKNYAKHGDCC